MITTHSCTMYNLNYIEPFNSKSLCPWIHVVRVTFFLAYQKVSSFLPTSGLQGISVSANLPTATIANLWFHLKNISMVIYLINSRFFCRSNCMSISANLATATIAIFEVSIEEYYSGKLFNIFCFFLNFLASVAQ